MIKVRISQQKLKTIGSFSLIGMLQQEYNLADLKKHGIDLVFEKWPSGPRMLEMPEYVPMCLIDSVLWLTKNGFQVTVNEEVFS